MRAVVYEGPNDIRLEDVPEPVVQDPEDAVVRVTTASICGSDTHIVHGLLPKMEPGRIIGHEFCGVVHEVGGAVGRFKPGDRVVGAAAVWCGRCRACRRGLYSACERGATFGHGPLLGDLPGAQADYVRVPFADNTLQHVTAPDDRIIFAGDILPTGYSAVAGLSPGGRGVREGDHVVVFGLGPVGLCSVASAKLFRPAKIIAVGNRAERLALAERLGADVTIDAAGTEDVRKAVRQHTDGWGADYIVEAVGKEESLENAIRVAAPGGVVAVVGAFQAPIKINAPRMQARNVTVAMGMGDLGAMPKLVKVIEDGELDVSPVVTHRMSLDDVIRAYEIFDKRLEGAVKILLTT
ncbi:MAG: alcohol dehydrogenase catalytic domain-containing protein [Actinobacteria bacterium]|jgi:alcohol dehydrogenase|nr:alcohol dehydrogenase catalytic domain-containing protein [Actinomycetota bacterium]